MCVEPRPQEVASCWHFPERFLDSRGVPPPPPVSAIQIESVVKSGTRTGTRAPSDVRQRLPRLLNTVGAVRSCFCCSSISRVLGALGVGRAEVTVTEPCL